MFVTFALIWKLIRFLCAKNSTNGTNDTNDTNNSNELNEAILRHQIDDALINTNLQNRSPKLPITRYSSGALSPSPSNQANTHSHSAHRSSYPSGLRVSTYTLRIGPRLFRDKSSFRYFHTS